MLSERFKQQLDDMVNLLVRKGYIPESGEQKEAFVKDFTAKLSNDIAGDLLMYTAALNNGEKVEPCNRWGVFTLLGDSLQQKDGLISFDAMIETYHDQQLLRLGSFQVMKNGQYIHNVEIGDPETLPPLTELLERTQRPDITTSRRQIAKNEMIKRSRKK